MSSESIDSLVSRPVIVQPTPVEQGQVPGQESPAPTDADARAAAAIFARENSERPPSLLGFAAAGMLVHDIVQDALAPAADDEDEEEEDAEPKRDEP
jgi:hypothetical protein